ncbi:carbon-nitrogen hydrolase [Violaceomyces palustris]|uniref:Carbon-nitrogen hydrolase n=1 Tax=Violaceomyces palustris TaxID=1673888 RepID=A0ACD0P5T3_9BASI|nr:carbon-nitrogen hydrolase [Violaceomyces palustris]
MSIEIHGGFSNSSDQKVKDRTINIALAQVIPSEAGPHGTLDGNGPDTIEPGLQKMKRWIKEAAEQGADVVVFPEYFLTGATHEAWRKVKEVEATRRSDEGKREETEEEHWLSFVISTAKEYDIDVVAGTVVELGTDPNSGFGHSVRPGGDQVPQSDRIPHRDPDHHQHAPVENEGPETYKDQVPDLESNLYNTAYYVSRQGRVEGRYTKRNLWHPERVTLSPATKDSHPDLIHPPVFTITTKRGLRLRAGMAICWDLAFPEVFRRMVEEQPPTNPTSSSSSSLDSNNSSPPSHRLSPDIVFVPTCWYLTDGGVQGFRWNPNSESDLLDSLCSTRAIENECILAMCNVSGPSPPQGFPESVLESLAEDEDQGLPLIGLGRSTVCSPFLNVVARLDRQDEALLLCSVDTQVLKDSREVYRVRYDLID